MISHLRNRLRSQTVQALMCFGDWSRLDLMPHMDLIQHLEHPELEQADDEVFVDDLVDVFV